MPHASSWRAVLTVKAVIPVAAGWGAVAGLRALPTAVPLPGLALLLLVAAIIASISVCAGGVVSQAEHLARRLGDPYGTLALTLSVVLIEVILIAAVMLGPGEHATIARDSVMAASMIVLTLVIGSALVVGGLRHRGLRCNRAGVMTYLGYLVVLIAAAFVVPGLIGVGGAYTLGQSVPIIALTVGLYGFFLYRQTGPQRAAFQEPATPATTTAPQSRPAVGVVLRRHGGEITTRVAVLLATMSPIVWLAHDMAIFLDDGLARIGAPGALAGIIIAVVVFLPEGITTIRAAWLGEAQRVSNLAHGALVSCVGLTLPVVLVVGLATRQTVVLAESPAGLLLLGVSLLLNVATFSSRHVTARHGAAHLSVFALYGLSVFT